MSYKKSSKVNIKPEQIELSANIKSKGEYKFKVNLHADVQSEVLIEVIAKRIIVNFSTNLKNFFKIQKK